MDSLENETLLKFYDSARQEMMSRIALRENSMMIFFGAVGALIAAAIQANQPLFLLIIPYLSLGISLIMLHHNAIIGAIIIYCTKELDEKLKAKDVDVAQWDNSQARLTSSRLTMHYRFWGDIGLILGPSAFAILYNRSLLLADWKSILIISFSIACAILSIIFLLKALNIRKTTFRQIRNETSGQGQKEMVS